MYAKVTKLIPGVSGK